MFHVAKTSGSCNQVLGFEWKSFHISSPPCLTAGTTPDGFSDNCVRDDQTKEKHIRHFSEQLNTPTSVRNYKLNESESVRNSHFKVPSVGKSDGCSFRGTSASQDENGKAHSSFQTPVRQINYSGSSCAKGVSVSRIDFSHGTETPDENKLNLDSFKTPIRPLVCNVSPGNNISTEQKESSDYCSRERKLGVVMETNIGLTSSSSDWISTGTIDETLGSISQV
ncbi:hypothetical protein L6452_43432 [Arctium lappa]|uniref:Uncharacterized protein n=1 Tax=Arctium lappa TaxID=4217 RepID=A0ACB8XDJ0_ARCLA|nr:hypothetical protein L6452_43432 [Arctium lappa]